MKDQEQTLTDLYRDFLENRTSPEQAERLKQLFKSDDEHTLRMLISGALKDQDSGASVLADEQGKLDDIYGKIKAEIMDRETETRKFAPSIRYAIISIAAVSVLLMGSLLFFNSYDQVNQNQTDIAIKDVLPGSNKAVLTLSDGKKVSLTNAPNGKIAEQEDAFITKKSEGQLVYSPNLDIAGAIRYNTIETPKGGQYQVLLPDGTKVWLNAASSLKYPISFGALKERRVELVGEAYFEVAHNKALPFRVITREQTVEVLGTHFNVNSYSDEKDVITTLEQGSVKVTSGRNSRVISPGVQTLLKPDGEMKVQEADMKTAMAWKEGKILFRDADIRTIMRQVARWYDLEIAYSGKVPDRVFNGGVERTANLSSLLKILELNDIHFKLVEEAGKKKLIVQ